MKSNPLSTMPTGLLLLPLILMFLVDIAKIAVPTLDSKGLYVAILLGSGMLYGTVFGMALERSRQEHARGKDLTRHACNNQATIS